MARKLLEAANSKLARQQEEGVEAPKVLRSRKAEKLPKSFRLGAVDIERLHRLSERLGEVAGRSPRQRQLRVCCCSERRLTPKNWWPW
jgi:hypothetical protein